MSDNGFCHKEAFWLLCDSSQKLGSGAFRTVYGSEVLPNSVIKVEEGAQSFQNVVEWETWKRVKDTPLEKWFAPCEKISACGAVLIMARTSPPSKYPALVPAFFTDLKRKNFGVYKGRFVCHDYGVTLWEGGFTKRMRKAGWWGLDY